MRSYIIPERRKSFCLCDATTPEAVRRGAVRNGLPVDRITEVRVLDPYLYSGHDRGQARLTAPRLPQQHRSLAEGAADM